MERDEDARRKRAADRLAGRLRTVGGSRPLQPAATPSAARASTAEHSPAGAVAALRRSLADSAARTDRRRSRTGEMRVPEEVAQHEMAAHGAANETPAADNPELEARQAEQAERWGDAARAWGRASDARPDQEALARRAALNYLKDGHQLSRGVEYAQRAVELAPGDAFTHRVLGQLYLEARMWQNARRALEQARALNPEDAAVHLLIQKARQHC